MPPDCPPLTPLTVPVAPPAPPPLSPLMADPVPPFALPLLVVDAAVIIMPLLAVSTFSRVLPPASWTWKALVESEVFLNIDWLAATVIFELVVSAVSRLVPLVFSTWKAVVELLCTIVDPVEELTLKSVLPPVSFTLRAGRTQLMATWPLPLFPPVVIEEPVNEPV